MSTKKRHAKEKSSTNEVMPVHFPNLIPSDTVENSPTYMKILQRTKGGSVYIKELDSLQHEIETIMLSIKKRKTALSEGYRTITTHQEKSEKKNPGNKSKGAASEKRTHSTESKPLKKHKGGSTSSRPKAKNTHVTKSEPGYIDSSVEILQKPSKVDTPGRFWANLEPYFSEINQDHLKFIEEWMKAIDIEEYLEIPLLGRHFADEWCRKEIEEEIKEGLKANENNRKLNNSSLHLLSENITSEIENKKDGDEDVPNTFAQRLIDSLIEEKVIAGLEDTIDASKELPECEPIITDHSNSITSKIKRSDHLEQRIREELKLIGVIEMEEEYDNETDSSDSNLLDELKEAQASLKMMIKHNLNKKAQLLKLAKEEINKQEVRKKINVIDAEIMDVLRRNPKKKSLTKKDRETVARLLKERKTYNEQLCNLNS